MARVEFPEANVRIAGEVPVMVDKQTSDAVMLWWWLWVHRNRTSEAEDV